MSSLTQFLRGAVKVTYSNATSGLTAVTVQAAIDELDLSLDGAISDVADLRTLSGTADGDTDLGTFTGATISDAGTIKAGMQELETAHEETDGNVDDLVTLSGMPENSTDLGTFTGTLIADGVTIKAALQTLEDAVQDNTADIVDIRTLTGTVDGSTNLGTFTGSTISDNGSVKAGMQELETAHEEVDANVNDLITLSGVAENSTDLGTFTGSTISDNGTVKAGMQELETSLELKANDADVIKKDGSVAFTADQSMGGFKLTNLATPTADGDAASKGYVDNIAAGVSTKDNVVVATTGPITLSGTQTIDGVALVAGQRVLVKDQASLPDNGIYDVAAGAWARSTDSDGTPTSEIKGGNIVFVDQGTANADTVFVLNADGEVGAGVGDQNWIIYSRAETITASEGVKKVGLDIRLDSSAAGDGLAMAAGVLSVNVDDVGIEINADTLRLKDLGVTTAKLDALAVTTAKLAATSVTAAKLGSDVAGTGLNGGNGSAIGVEYSTTGEAAHAVEASFLNGTGGAGAVGILDAGSNFTATSVEGALTEIDGRLDTLEGAAGTAWAIKTVAYTAVDGDQLLVDTATTGAVTITLPAAPSAGDEVTVRDAKRNTETAAITIARNGQPIEALAEDLTLDVNGSTVRMVYLDATTGWTVGLI